MNYSKCEFGYKCEKEKSNRIKYLCKRMIIRIIFDLKIIINNVLKNSIVLGPTVYKLTIRLPFCQK